MDTTIETNRFTSTTNKRCVAITRNNQEINGVLKQLLDNVSDMLLKSNFDKTAFSKNGLD